MHFKTRSKRGSFVRSGLMLLCAQLLLLAGCANKKEIDSTMDTTLTDQMLQSVIEGTFNEAEEHLTFGIRTDSYEVYQDRYSEIPFGSEEIDISLSDFTAEGEGFYWEPQFYKTGKGTLITPEEGSVTFTVDVPSDALYQLYIEYYPVEGKGDSIERQVEINGEIPFYGARHMILSRIWRDQGEALIDNRGNEIRPSQVEAPRLNSDYFTDYLGYSEVPFYFYFQQGENQLTLRSIKEPLAITRILLTRKDSPPSYAEVARGYTGITSSGLPTIKVQAEHMFEKSDPMMYSVNDRSSPATEPSHYSNIRLNTTGGDRWKLPGQWISWEVVVPEDGLYKMAFRGRQNLISGLKVNRILYVDGEIPFLEAENLTIDYSTEWQMAQLADEEGEPLLIHLTEGRHLITLDTSLGEFGTILQKAADSTFALSYAYRKVLMLTSATPDPYRDYNVDRELPSVMEILAEQSLIMAELADQVEAYSGDRAHAAILTRLSRLLAKMYTNPFSIPRSIKNLKTNIGALGTWMYESREQPLQIDYIMLMSPETKVPSGRAGFFRTAGYKIAAFFASFFEDYENVGDTYDNNDNVLTVWMTGGRDQAQMLKRMVDDTFTPQTGIPVNVRLVLPEILLPATVAGKAPDVAMQTWNAFPVDYAIRNAAADLTQFPDFDEVSQRFHPSALVAYEYQGGVYGLPETQEFLIMFYRKDIFDDLGLEVPRTWEDLFSIMPDLQKRYMEFVVPCRETLNNVTTYGSVFTYQMFLYQNGGEMYKGDGIDTNLDSEVGKKAFEQWTDLYTDYKLPLQYNFINRFRIGEAPIGIASYINYNTLSVFAPEIRGLWGFVPLPANVREDGTLDRSSPSWGQVSMIMEQSEQKEEAWTFLKWWSSAEIQTRFGNELESIMGPAARLATANQEAVDRLSWPIEDYRQLMAQWEWVKGVPEVPGSYYVPRHVDNAFRMTNDNGWNPRESVLEYSRKINDELTAKRSEFGLVTLEDLNDEQ